VTDLLQVGSDWLGTMRKAHLSRTVVYQRGDDSVEVLATVGRTVFETADAYGVVEHSESRDFLVAAADLVLDGTVTLPQRGDKILETQDGKTFVYEVMAPGREPHYRFSDAYRRTLRIHTKQVEAPE